MLKAFGEVVGGGLAFFLPRAFPLRPSVGLFTEALLGETVTVYETSEEGWAWGQLEADGYVGWLSANAIALAGAAPPLPLVMSGIDALLTPERDWRARRLGKNRIRRRRLRRRALGRCAAFRGRGWSP